MNRRELIAGTAALLATGITAPAGAAAGDDPAGYLGATGYIDSDHPRIAARAAALTAGLDDDTEKALALFAFVRDGVPFGFARGFWDRKASDVLGDGRGYCVTKSTLFVALLRAAGLPARQMFVDIHAGVLAGIIDPGTAYVDHAYVEVFLRGGWRATDAYIVDRALFAAAQPKLRAEGGLMGYGVHATGTDRWDGRAPAFSQYNIVDPRPLGTRRFGVYRDVGDFYRRAERPWNRLNPVLRLGFGILAQGANRNADRLRQRGGLAKAA
ncbi:MAG: hypothetical protein MI806_16545 [Minwuiales bacterium]|nr:hypothetical protein [Minwuiales bacterium]